jgi:hypothetical protein
VKLLALASAVPIWRSLRIGDEGADVAGIQRELVRQGVHITPTGVFDTATGRALTLFGRRAGVQIPAQQLPVSSIVWLPTPSVTVRNCSAQLGARLPKDAELVEIVPAITALRVSFSPGAVPGPRSLTIDNVIAFPDHSGLVTNNLELKAIAATPSFAVSQNSAGAVALSGTSALVRPIDTSVVPPSSIIRNADGVTCVEEPNGATANVSVVSSQLGATLVLFSGIVPKKVRIQPDASTKCTSTP